ncbi:MAG TPA: DUF5658 family protein [Terriglobales bacterium]|nr:DUF5658 family protein [Terriglobales bacterium]
MTNLLLVFFFLQAADLATTAVALNLGGVENNPLVRVFMWMGPLAGLIAAKVVVLLVAAACAVSRQHRPLRFANAAFAGIVVWNLSVIARLLA